MVFVRKVVNPMREERCAVPPSHLKSSIRRRRRSIIQLCMTYGDVFIMLKRSLECRLWNIPFVISSNWLSQLPADRCVACFARICMSHQIATRNIVIGNKPSPAFRFMPICRHFDVHISIQNHCGRQSLAPHAVVNMRFVPIQTVRRHIARKIVLAPIHLISFTKFFCC